MSHADLKDFFVMTLTWVIVIVGYYFSERYYNKLDKERGDK